MPAPGAPPCALRALRVAGDIAPLRPVKSPVSGRSSRARDRKRRSRRACRENDRAPWPLPCLPCRLFTSRTIYIYCRFAQETRDCARAGGACIVSDCPGGEQVHESNILGGVGV